MTKVFLCWIALCFLVLGQEEKMEVSGLRVLALGDLPPVVERIVDGERVQIDGPPFEIPPEEIFVENASGKIEPLGVRLNQWTDWVAVPGARVEIPILTGSPLESERWATVTLPGTGKYMALVTKSREPENQDWREVQSFLLNDGLAFFPQGMIRFVNTSQSAIAVILGEERAFQVESGNYVFRKYPAEPIEMIVARKNSEDAWKTIFRHQVTLKAGERYHVVAYDGDNPKGKIQLFMRPEQVGNGLVFESKENERLNFKKSGKLVLDEPANNLLGRRSKSEVSEDREDLVSAVEKIEELSSSGESSNRMRTWTTKGKSNQREHSTESGVLERGVKSHLNVTLEIVLLVMFVGLLIWWGLRFDFFRRKE